MRNRSPRGRQSTRTRPRRCGGGVPDQGAEHPAKQIAVAAHRRRYRHDGEMDALRGRNWPQGRRYLFEQVTDREVRHPRPDDPRIKL